MRTLRPAPLVLDFRVTAKKKPKRMRDSDRGPAVSGATNSLTKSTSVSVGPLRRRGRAAILLRLLLAGTISIADVQAAAEKAFD
jgi:hypothetical protein